MRHADSAALVRRASVKSRPLRGRSLALVTSASKSLKINPQKKVSKFISGPNINRQMTEQPASVYHRQKVPIILCALYSAVLHAAPRSAQASEHTCTFVELRAVFVSRTGSGNWLFAVTATGRNGIGTCH